MLMCQAVVVVWMVLTAVAGPTEPAAANDTMPQASSALAAADGWSPDEAIPLRIPLLDYSQPPAGAAALPSDSAIPLERLRWHVPDPDADRQAAFDRLAKLEQEGDKAAVAQIKRVIERVDAIRREKQIHLSLEEVLRRTLENSYAIQVLSYNPAIETTRVVEAEAAFDAVFFTDIVKNKIDRPSGNELISTDLDLFNSSYGVRKLLPTGMSVSGAYQLNRTKSAISFQQINPEYTSNFVFDMRQPLLRGFGIDYNRSLIIVAKNDRRIADHAFRRQVRDTLRQVEEFYWRLVQARRDIVTSARLLSEFETIYDYLAARESFDITPVQIAATRANLEQSKFDFVRRKAAVFDAEDQLTAGMNWDEVNLADDIEIIPDDSPKMARIIVDRLAEAQSALDHRPEIKEQELRVENAKILVGRAKNEELPRFDLTFRQTYDGLAGNADRSFDELTRMNFIEYFIGVEFEVPIGNRGPRAAHKRAVLQHAQAVAALKQVFEEVIFDVNVATRALGTSYDQILPSFEAAEAREREVNLAVARAERKDYNTLVNELNARQSLATARRAMIASIVDYNIAIIDLERAKGTLLEYNNVLIPDEGN